jgi:HEAT repeat protein
MNIQTIRTVASYLMGVALLSPASAAELTLPRDGWASWQVEAVEGAPDWCCWKSWDESDTQRKACRLDDDRGNFGTRDHTTADAMRVYARVAGGKVERVRVLSATCPVETATPIANIDTTTDDSARWLIALSKRNAVTDKHDDLGENALAALATHRGERAQDALVAMARGDSRVETRKKAVFWLAIMRGVAGADVVTAVMFNDKDPEVREHGAFAITQSRSPRIAADLTRLGNTDTDGEVRAQAWFWLAHTGAASSEEAIGAALRKDKDDHVREQAIFALSQLPDERATRALIAAAEDQSLSREQRKRAVFWLAQSESEAAQKYLEKVLARNVAN